MMLFDSKTSWQRCWLKGLLLLMDVLMELLDVFSEMLQFQLD